MSWQSNAQYFRKGLKAKGIIWGTDSRRKNKALCFGYEFRIQTDESRWEIRYNFQVLLMTFSSSLILVVRRKRLCEDGEIHAKVLQVHAGIPADTGYINVKFKKELAAVQIHTQDFAIGHRGSQRSFITKI